MEGAGPTARDVLDALTAQIAVLDEHGAIVDVNEAWKTFGSENGAPHGETYVGRSYLSVCEAAEARGEDLSGLSDKLRALIAGRRSSFVAEYRCDSDAGQRWFQLTATRLASAGARGFVIAHEPGLFGIGGSDEGLVHGLRRHRRSDLAGRVPTHAVRDDEDAVVEIDVPRIFVVFPHRAGLGARIRFQLHAPLAPRCRSTQTPRL